MMRHSAALFTTAGRSHAASHLRLPGLTSWLWLVCIYFTGAAYADDSPPSGTVNPFYGSFATSVPIAVPAYHGLEPHLELTYNSAGRNGLVGVGWGLSGASFIERGRQGGGSPRYDSDDRYFLDGIELMECTAQGGTHCTKIQNYSRIDKNSDDTWTLTGTNGNVATYQAKHDTPRGTFRWLLSSIEDPRGNNV